jgi:hypothetical protein
MIPVKSGPWVILASLIHQVFLPAIGSGVDIKMAERAAIGGGEWFGGQALLLLRVRLVGLLVDCFLAARALLVVLAVGALSHQMGGQRVDLDALAALAADYEHGTCVEVMHVFVVLLRKALVHPLAELADFVLVYFV